MSLAGSEINISNYRLRLLLYLFSGIVTLGAVLWWRTQLLMNAEYVEIPRRSLKETQLLVAPNNAKAHNDMIKKELYTPSQ